MKAFVLLSVLLFQSQGVVPDHQSRELDPKTRPSIELEPFRKLKCVTVSEYTIPPPNGDGLPTRVYRFTYKARFKDEVKRWSKLFPVKGGWSVDESTDRELIISRDVKHAKVKGQGLILGIGRFEFDPSVRARTKVIPTAEYVRVSFNENLKAKAAN